MRKIILSLVVLSFYGCAHYAPLQMVGGARHKDKVELRSCSLYLIGIPLERESLTIAGAMTQLEILPEQVHSIENSYWPYFGYIIGENCIKFNMNSNYSLAAKIDKEMEQLQEQKLALQKQEEAARLEMAKIKEQTPGSTTGNWEKDVDVCNILEGQKRMDCIKKVNKFYNNK